MKNWFEQFLKFDARISKILRVQKEQKRLSIVLKIFAHSGDSWFWLAGLFITWLLSEGEWRQRSAFLAVGLFIMAAAVIVLKFSIRRPRPEGEWGQIYRITDPHSFPSGHAARSAALAVMGLALGPTWFAVALCLWSPWVGLSRVALGVHYLSDVIAGWLVGAAMGGVALLMKPVILQIIDLFLNLFIKN